MTGQSYPDWDKIEYIHTLQREFEWVNMVLSIAEYGYKEFFANYSVFLKESYAHSETMQDLLWDEAYGIYTDEYYSQLWRGLDMQPFGYLEERKSRKTKRYEWFDSMYRQEAPPEKTFNISNILK